MENRKINKCLMQGWTVISTVLFAAYVLEVVKGNRTIPYFIVFSLMNLGPLLLSWLVYRKNPESGTIRYLCTIFYGILYVFVLLTGATPMVFTYFLPIMYLLMLCNDTRLLGWAAACNVAANLVSIVVQLTVDKRPAAEYLTEWEIQIAAALLCSIFACMAVKVSTFLHDEQIREAAEGEERLRRIFEKVTEVSGVVEQDTERMLGRLEELESSSERTAVAMQDIVTGSQQSAEMVEKQMHRTADIQEIIDRTNLLSEQIAGHVRETSEKVGSGIGNMKRLSQSARGVEENSGRVIEHMSMLRETTNQVQEIISIIGGIAGQTNLLALNASIEAARAGDAGRGFAVVANEINELAGQTKEATQNIAGMVGMLREKAQEASDAVLRMGEMNREQNEIIFETDAAFGKIRDGVEEVQRNVDEENAQMELLMSANAGIVESIHTISAVTEEVTANTNQTQDITAANREAVEQVTRIAQDLGRRVAELNSYI